MTLSLRRDGLRQLKGARDAGATILGVYLVTSVVSAISTGEVVG